MKRKRSNFEASIPAVSSAGRPLSLNNKEMISPSYKLLLGRTSPLLTGQIGAFSRGAIDGAGALSSRSLAAAGVI